MRYWYFLFEGKLKNETEYNSFYSSVILPVNDNQEPNKVLVNALSEYDAELVRIEDNFEFLQDDYDLEDADNQVWFDWVKEVKINNSAVFTPWQRFNS